MLYEVITKRFPDTSREETFSFEQPVPDHTTGLTRVIELITAAETGVISGVSEIDGVGHRIVHGGESFSRPTLIDQKVIEGIRELVPLAPLHNPGGLAGIETALRLLPGVPNVAVFDTAFLV